MVNCIQFSKRTMDRSLIDCPVCFELLLDPRILIGCQHTICANCIKNMGNSSNTVTCPICRATSNVPVDGELPRNLAVQKIVEDFQLTNLLMFNRKDTVAVRCSTPSCSKISYESDETVLTMRDFWVCLEDHCNRIIVCSTCLKIHHDGHGAITYLDEAFGYAKDRQPHMLLKLARCKKLRDAGEQFV